MLDGTEGSTERRRIEELEMDIAVLARALAARIFMASTRSPIRQRAWQPSA